MRFKAKLAPEQLHMLHQIITPMSRIASTGSTTSPADTGAASSSWLSQGWTRHGSVLYFDNTVLRISAKGSASRETDQVCCFAELFTNVLFLEHRIQSVADDNAIVMEVDLVQLRMALQSIVQEQRSEKSALAAAARGGGGMVAHAVTIVKLAKRNNVPCLCLDATLSASGMAVHHSIPVRILRPTEMKQYYPPALEQHAHGDRTVQVQLAPDKPLRSVVEGIRAMNAPILYVKACQRTGELTLMVERDGASIRIFLHQLAVPMKDQQTPATRAEASGNDTRSDQCTVKVDTKKLCASLQWQHQQQQQPSSSSSMVSQALLCLVKNEMLVVHVVLHPPALGFFTYYVPVHYLPEDPADE